MSSIILDPTSMLATAQVVGDNARLAGDTVASLQTTCSADVPAHLGAWLSDELHQIEVQATTVAVLYTAAALDTALRARQIQADQSLVAAWTPFSPPAAAGTTSVDLQAALAAGSVVGGYEEPFTTDLQQPATAVVGGTPLLEISDVPLMPLTGGPGPVSGTMLLNQIWSEGSAGVLAPRGTTYLGGGVVVDDRGNRGTLADVYVRPGRDGEHEVRS